MIEDDHKNNFEIIKKFNLKEGTILKNKSTGDNCEIKHIHSLYGWVTTKYKPFGYKGETLKHDFSNIDKFEVV